MIRALGKYYAQYFRQAKHQVVSHGRHSTDLTVSRIVYRMIMDDSANAQKALTSA